MYMCDYTAITLLTERGICTKFSIMSDAPEPLYNGYNTVGGHLRDTRVCTHGCESPYLTS